MKFRLIKPAPSLKHYVKTFWVLESNEPFLYHAMADGLPELIFQYSGTANKITLNGNIALPLSYVYGQSDLFKQQVTSANCGIFGVYLYPFVIPELFGLPANELNNQIVDLSLLPGNDGNELADKMMTACSDEMRVNIISEFIEERILRSKINDRVVPLSISQIIHAKGKTDIKLMAQQFNISTRQFERKFIARSGFSPKLFSRITRFQSALNEYANQHKSLTEVAYDCGYYDQSHFIRDFKEFSGLHPKLYFSGRAQGTELRANI